jgi:AbrB family looped-hinge helix DNA binding protein
MTTKGQITVPLEVRTRLGLETGSRVDFTEREDGYLLSVRKISGADLAGLLHKPGVAVSLEDMERAIADGALEGASL